MCCCSCSLIWFILAAFEGHSAWDTHRFLASHLLLENPKLFWSALTLRPQPRQRAAWSGACCGGMSSTNSVEVPA
jgi:hypothetical protein